MPPTDVTMTGALTVCHPVSAFDSLSGERCLGFDFSTGIDTDHIDIEFDSYPDGDGVPPEDMTAEILKEKIRDILENSIGQITLFGAVMSRDDDPFTLDDLDKGTKLPISAKYPNHIWSYDFMEDFCLNGQRLRLLTVVDEFTRESLAIHIDTSIPSAQVQIVLQILFLIHGKPTYLRSDNGPEFIAQSIQSWLKETGVETKH